MVAGRTAGSTKLKNAPKTSPASCVCHAPSQLPRALQPGGEICPAPKFNLTFPFLLGRGRRLNPMARDITSGDAYSDDPPKPGFLARQDLQIYRRGTDEELFAMMKKTLRDYAGEEGVKAADWFAKGNGEKYRHGPDDPLSGMALATRQFVTSYSMLSLRVREAVKKLAAGGKVPNFAGLSVKVPPTTWGLLDFPTLGVGKVADNETALKAIFGGTQGEEIWVTALKHNPVRKVYALKLRWIILDHFGVDESDLYHGSLYAFYVLQHERKGFRAYVNELVIDTWLAGAY